METSSHASKRRTRQALSLAFTAGLVSPAGLAARSSSLSSARPFTGKTPAQVLAIADAAEVAKGSVHIVEADSIGGSTFQLVTDAGTSQGKQILTRSTIGNATFLVVSAQMAYVKGDATYFEQNFSMSQGEAAEYAGQWIAVPSSSQYYALIAEELTVSSVITEQTPSAPLSLAKPTTVDGKSVVGVSGGLTGAPSGYTGTQVLYISTMTPYLPVSVVAHGTNAANQTLSFREEYSHYGEHVSVTAPARSIPISSIP